MNLTASPYPMPAPDEMPTNTATWTPDPQRAVLLVHDMQAYFLRSFPTNGQPGDALLANAGALVRTCRQSQVPVVYTAQPGSMTDGQRGLLREFWGPGMRATTEDRQIVETLAPDDDSAVFTKWRYSAFHRSKLLEHLRSLGRDQLIICGVYAHIGCLMTAVEAFTNDLETFLVGDAVADFSLENHRMALDYAAARCAVVASAQTVLTHLRRQLPVVVPDAALSVLTGSLTTSDLEGPHGRRRRTV